LLPLRWYLSTISIARCMILSSIVTVLMCSDSLTHSLTRFTSFHFSTRTKTVSDNDIS
jgi:hypothetical protein